MIRSVPCSPSRHLGVFNALMLASVLLVAVSGPKASAQPAVIQTDRWMSQTWDDIKDRPLRYLVIPGTHDSGAYDLNPLSLLPEEIVTPETGAAIYTVLALVKGSGVAAAIAAAGYGVLEVVEGYSETQSLDVYGQLHAGARYFDLRFAKQGNQWRIHHTLLGPTGDDILSQIKRYLDESGHDKEIIILRFNTMIAGDGGDNDHEEFVAKIYDYLAPHMAKQPSSGFLTSPAEIHATGKQVLVFYGKDDQHYTDGKALPLPSNQTEDLLWDAMEKNDFYSKDGGYPTPRLWRSEDLLVNYWLLTKEVDGAIDQAYPLSLTMGMDNSGSMLLNKANPVPGYPGYWNLREAAEFTNPRQIRHLIQRPRDGVNLVAIDYFVNQIFFQPDGTLAVGNELVREAMVLNKNPAKVTVRVLRVDAPTDICDDGPISDTCDPYPNITINGKVSTDKYSRTLDDRQRVRRGTHLDDDEWVYTVAVPWEEEVEIQVSIWDEDDLDGDDLIAFNFPAVVFDADDMESIRTNGDSRTQVFDIKTGGQIRAEIDVTVEPWSVEPPTVTAKEPKITVGEGTVANNCGTFADIDSDSVSVRASFGSLTQNGAYAGTWDWSYTTRDDLTAEVRVTAWDGLKSGVADFDLVVTNIAPTVTANGSVIDEHGVATVSGTITDPGTLDTFTVVIDWGDGKTNSYNYPAGTTAYSGTHQYLDDDPTGTPSDVYPVKVTVIDDDQGEGSASTTVTVRNLAPTAAIRAITDEFGNMLGENVDVALVFLDLNMEVSFADAGTLDTHTVTFDWGDGTVHGGLVTSPASDGHAYQATGITTVRVTVVDDDTGAVSVSTTLDIVDAIGAVLDAIEDLTALREEPGLGRANAKWISEALNKLMGNKNGKAANGALDLFEKGNMNAALVKISHAMALLEQVTPPSPALEATMCQLVLTAKSAVMELLLIAEQNADKPMELRGLELARAYVAEGDQLHKDGYPKLAVDAYRVAGHLTSRIK